MNTKPYTTAQNDLQNDLQDDLVEQMVTQLKNRVGEKFPDSSAAAGGAEMPFPPSSDKSGTPTGE
jgi:hypothetical protein